MRMNLNAELDAKQIINNYSEERLCNIFFKFGELRESRKIAKTIIIAREKSQINSKYYKLIKLKKSIQHPSSMIKTPKRIIRIIKK